VTANCVAWLPVMELLQESYTVTAVDQRGHGPVVVVRHSLGARNAIAAAARRPTG
jgi:pimeloyl-ACP methyl ester carboxylesterase